MDKKVAVIHNVTWLFRAVHTLSHQFNRECLLVRVPRAAIPVFRDPSRNITVAA
jgi:hypothetical protein